MRIGRSRWFSLVIATMVWSSVWPGWALAQDTAIPFRPACDLVTTDAVSTVLGADVTLGDAIADASCSYLDGDQEVAAVGLSPSPPFVFGRLVLPGATETTVGGLPALSSTRGTLSTAAGVVIVGLQDGGTLEVRVDRESGATSPLAAARALAEAILASGPVTARASVSTAEPIGYPGSPCELITRAELKRLTGLPFADGKLDVNHSRCRYRTKDEQTEVSLGIWAADLGIVRRETTSTLTVGDREAVFVPATELLAVDLGGGQLLSVRIPAAGTGLKSKDLPALRVAIAETAMGRMAPGGITCPLIPADALLGASGLDFRPIPKNYPNWCWFVTADEQTGLLLRIVAKRDVAYVRAGLRSAFPDLPTPTDLEVSGHPASGTTGPSGTMLHVNLDGSSGQDGTALFAVLVGAHPSAPDPLALLESIAAEVLDGI